MAARLQGGIFAQPPPNGEETWPPQVPSFLQRSIVIQENLFRGKIRYLLDKLKGVMNYSAENQGRLVSKKIVAIYCVSFYFLLQWNRWLKR